MEKLGLPTTKCDEMGCIVQVCARIGNCASLAEISHLHFQGCNFLLKNISDEAFVYQRRGNPEYKFQTQSPRHMYPYLLVTIGSGVSIIKVESGAVYFKRAK